MLTFAVTAYEETHPRRLGGRRILDSVAVAVEHPVVDEIVVVDDGSGDYAALETMLDGTPKMHLYRNAANLGVFGNKLESVFRSTGEWVVVADSDNYYPREYFDCITRWNLLQDTWYCPSFARPDFNYRTMAGEWDLKNVYLMERHRMAACCLNTGNQVVHRERFTETFAYLRGPRADLRMSDLMGLSYADRLSERWRLAWNACDSLLLNKAWLEAGGSLAVLSGLEYDHYRATVDEGNYVRSPVEKEELGRRLLEDLYERSKSCQK